MRILLMYSPDPPSSSHLDRLRGMDANISVTVATCEEDAIAAAKEADIIFGHRFLRQCVPHAQKLRWVQSTTNGVDRLPCNALAKQGVTLTRFTGSAADVGRHAVALALAVNRGLYQAWNDQANRRWTKDISPLPPPERAVVFGTGNIGRAIARFLQGMDLEVAGVKRSLDHKTPARHFDRLYDRHSWTAALEDADWCFLALPHTEETEHMIDRETLHQLPDHATVVNVGRGETLDVAHLASVLRNGHLGGAALDVLPADLEPLPPDHFLWDVPRLLITPHVAAYSPIRQRRVEAFIESQLQRFLSGQPLKEVVISRSDHTAVSG